MELTRNEREVDDMTDEHSLRSQVGIGSESDCLESKKKKKRRGKKLTVANWVFAQTTHVDAAICGLACRVVFGRYF